MLVVDKLIRSFSPSKERFSRLGVMHTDSWVLRLISKVRLQSKYSVCKRTSS